MYEVFNDFNCLLQEVKNQADDVVQQRNLREYKDVLSWYKQTV